MRPALPGLVLLALALPVAAPADDAGLRGEALFWFQPVPVIVPALPGPPVNSAMVDLGRALYFDPRLSASGREACAACHAPGRAGAEARRVSRGHRWQTAATNAPTVLNAALNIAAPVVGRRFPPANAVLVAARGDGDPLTVTARLRADPALAARFALAFPGESAPVDHANAARAVAAFVATLITPEAPFDRFLLGEDGALTTAQKRGLTAFMAAGCTACHAGVNLGGDGHRPAWPDRVATAEDRRIRLADGLPSPPLRRTGALRNVALTAPYLHDGSAPTLGAAIAAMPTRDGAALTKRQAADIAAFLASLTGRLPAVEPPGTAPEGRAGR